MLTLIFDIDGTLTDMWPIERAVLSELIQPGQLPLLDSLKRQGVNNLYNLYCQTTKTRVGRLVFRVFYSRNFETLREDDALPMVQGYPCVNFIRQNGTNFGYVYATGGLKAEAEYVLECLGILELFNLEVSTSKDNYKFSKATGRPFAKTKRQVGECYLITDSQQDVDGAEKAGVPSILISKGQIFYGSDLQ